MTTREWSLLGIAAISIVVVYGLMEAFPQYPSYYNLADTRAFLRVPNALDVLSNLPYLLVGAAGLIEVSRWRDHTPNAAHKRHYLVFFFGVLLTAFGSAYFHWRPAHDTLLWDRLPMTILFMGFLTSVISELVSLRAARVLLPVLLIVGVFSVFYWAWTESGGRGDLRLYGLVQFLPIVLILLMLALYRSPPGYVEVIGYLVFCYAAAKVFEQYDHEIFSALGLVSGHSLKHLISGASGAFLLLWLKGRNADAARDRERLGDGLPIG